MVFLEQYRRRSAKIYVIPSILWHSSVWSQTLKKLNIIFNCLIIQKNHCVKNIFICIYLSTFFWVEEWYNLVKNAYQS